MKTNRNIKASEFDWLGYCTSCNIDCCHNIDPTIPKNECTKQKKKNNQIYFNDAYILNNTSDNNPIINPQNKNQLETIEYDNRLLECRLFPFDIKNIDKKLVWILQDQCRATPKLDYGKFIRFFEGHFSRTIPLEHIRHYVEYNRLNIPEKYETNNFKVLREINWQIEQNG